jgi:DNA topoisomerase-1
MSRVGALLPHGPHATLYLSHYERGFLSYLERAPDAAALLRSA